MLDVRYHMFYLCAVFLMMGFGILIGEALYPHQVKAQTKYLAALKAQANSAVQQGQAARDQLAKTEQAIDALRPALVRGKLDGRRVLVIQTGDYPDAVTAAQGALADSGATVAVTVSLTDRWAILTPKQRAALLTSLSTGDAVDENAPAVQDNTALLKALAALLAQGTAGQPANQQARDALEGQSLITISGAGDLSRPTSLFVLVGGGKGDGGPADSPAALDTALVAQLNAVTGDNARIVGCEPLDAVVSFIPAYQGADLATVDCVDQPLGQLALPFALRGEKDDYGLKPTAARQIPASLEGNTSS
ncbi:MAG: copper transporter [Armatimonadetes bacterium]|nr:copper transporter [Armatimonadota bacterium]